MHQLKVLVIASLGNPLGTNWVHGFKGLGCNVAVLDWRDVPATQEQLKRWGCQDLEASVFNWGASDDQRSAIITALSGEPDVLFGWWGSPILNPLYKAYQSFPSAKVIHCVDTFPNAANVLGEVREIWRYRNADAWINGYVFYSEAMRRLFWQRVPTSRGKPYMAAIEPFLKKAFAQHSIENPDLPIQRFDERPHIIYIGRGDQLWSKDSRFAKDALGSFLAKLSKCGVHVFVHESEDLRELTNFHPYPEFSNADLFEGRFAQYISQFDANLTIYNEVNGTIRRRVSTGLSTRLASALTSTCPVAVTSTSQFIKEYWKDAPFGFTFNSVEELADILHDTQQLASLRSNMEKVHDSHSLEAQSYQVTKLIKNVLDLP